MKFDATYFSDMGVVCKDGAVPAACVDALNKFFGECSETMGLLRAEVYEEEKVAIAVDHDEATYEELGAALKKADSIAQEHGCALDGIFVASCEIEGVGDADVFMADEGQVTEEKLPAALTALREFRMKRRRETAGPHAVKKSIKK